MLGGALVDLQTLRGYRVPVWKGCFCSLFVPCLRLYWVLLTMSDDGDLQSEVVSLMSSLYVVVRVVIVDFN